MVMEIPNLIGGCADALTSLCTRSMRLVTASPFPASSKLSSCFVGPLLHPLLQQVLGTLTLLDELVLLGKLERHMLLDILCIAQIIVCSKSPWEMKVVLEGIENPDT